MMPTLRPTILVVDDDLGMRDALHLILDDDYRVLDAADGAQALEILASMRVDVMLLDLVMERLDGLEVLQRRREFLQDVPIIVVSGLNNAWAAASAMRLGAVDYVTKPFDEEGLLALIRSTLTSTSLDPAANRVTNPRILCTGVSLGIVASLTVLLRHQCRIDVADSIAATLSHVTTFQPDIVIVDLTSLTLEPVAALHRIHAQSPRSHLIVIDSRVRRDELIASSWAFMPRSPSVCDVLSDIRTHVEHLETCLPKYSRRVTAVLDYLGTHYTHTSVVQVGRAVGAAPYHLSNVFRAETGISLKSYVNQLRIESAKCLLFGTTEKIETVAARVGLHDASHLSRLFLKHTGNRPGAFRRHLAQDPTRVLSVESGQR